MGELSIIRPPASKKAAMTSAHSSRRTGSSPTLKVIQEPSPTSGSASPLDGTGRVSGGGACAVTMEGVRTAAAPVAAISPSRERRLKLGVSVIGQSPFQGNRFP